MNKKMNGKREAQNKENLRKLHDAIRYFIDLRAYDEITVRNICRKAELSNGSFYNIYDSMNSFVTQYVFEQFYQYAKGFDEKFTHFHGLTKIIECYCLFTDYCLFKGVEYMRFFQANFNSSVTSSPESKFRNSAIQEVIDMLRSGYGEACEAGELNPDYKSDILFPYMDMVVYGNICTWCSFNEKIPLTVFTKRLLLHFLEPATLAEYYPDFCKYGKSEAAVLNAADF